MRQRAIVHLLRAKDGFEALVRKAQLEADAANFTERLDSNRDLYTFALGLDPLATTAADPLEPIGNDDERRYALIAGGLAYALNALAKDYDNIPSTKHIKGKVSI